MQSISELVTFLAARAHVYQTCCVVQILAALHGQDHILMECSFPAEYPNKPFFLRIISPRMCWYTGKFTCGSHACL